MAHTHAQHAAGHYKAPQRLPCFLKVFCTSMANLSRKPGHLARLPAVTSRQASTATNIFDKRDKKGAERQGQAMSCMPCLRLPLAKLIQAHFQGPGILRSKLCLCRHKRGTCLFLHKACFSTYMLDSGRPERHPSQICSSLKMLMLARPAVQPAHQA